MAMELSFVYRHIAAFLLPLWTCRHHGFTGTNYHKQTRQCHMEVCIKSSAGPVFQWKQPAFTWPTKRLRSMVENCFLSWNILRAWSFHFKLHVAEGGLTVGMTSCTNRFFKSHLESSRRICFGEAKLRAIIIHIYIYIHTWFAVSRFVMFCWSSFLALPCPLKSVFPFNSCTST